jgi:transcriptional regulator with XRE-family HTH domain
MVTTQGKSFGATLKKLRLMMKDDRGKPEPWTQYQLHKASGVSEAEISQIECKGRQPQDATIVRLSSALGAPQLLPPHLR